MVRTYIPKNCYRLGSKLSNDDFLSILRGYIWFIPPQKQAREIGLSKQTVTDNYLWIGKVLYSMPPIWVKHIHMPQPQIKLNFDDEDYVAYWRDDARPAYLLKQIFDRLWKVFYQRFRDGCSQELYRQYIKTGQRPIDESIEWHVGKEMWKSWKGISEKNFRYHWALINVISHTIKMNNDGFFKPISAASSQKILQFTDESRELCFNAINSILKTNAKPIKRTFHMIDTVEHYEVARPDPEATIPAIRNYDLLNEYLKSTDRYNAMKWRDFRRGDGKLLDPVQHFWDLKK